ncbi:Pelle-like serine/threonine-protein kinase pik-1 [Frankliniella fusca]|uniref:Pelle-like serine/threonine-protein kinase pik-1 n=1 Tax=Frankliniella fusca TaxID=407009 RepID=A0AAE1LQD9_9NEOP|nr:Pelle-like serine/threonine-protein kinase pik-1 [Frankliniella fusca]
MMGETTPITKYIYDLPVAAWKDLCRVLDLHDKWKTLGGLMKFSVLDIQCLENLERRGNSPAEQLLTDWGLQNHTVQELFVLLSRMNHFQAMSILKLYVDPKYHQLMSEGEESWTKLLLDAKNCAEGHRQHAEKNLVSSAAGHASNMTDVRHNLNVVLPETHKTNKPGFSDKIQNIGNPVSLEENGRQPEDDSPSPQTPGTARSPPVLTPNAASRFNGTGQPQLSPVGMAALSNMQMGQHHFDLRAISSPQRKLSDGSMVTIPSEYQSKGDSRESQEVQFQQSLRELQVLQRIRHENILQLYGVSFNGNQPCLVYQFMEKGSLEDRLQCRVLFELATGLRAFDDKRVHKYLKEEVTNHKDVLQLMDPKIDKDPKDLMTFLHLITLGKNCVSNLPKDRPEMKVVCQKLDQISSSAAQVTPRELQELYDKMHEMHPKGNSAQPGSGQPQMSVSRHPAFTNSHPQMAVPFTGQPVYGVPVNVPGKGGSQGGGYIDGSANGHVSNNITLSRPSNPPASPQQPLAVTYKQQNEGAGIAIGESLLPTVLPLKSPLISVMPPTVSDASSPSPSYSSESDDEDFQPSQSVMPDEQLVSVTEEQGPENLPLLSVLGNVGIRDEPTSESPDSEQPVKSS